MVTNYPQGLTATRPASVEVGDDKSIGFLARLLRIIKQFFCSLHGHDSLLHFADSRVTLVCASCGYESPGWDVGHSRPRVRFQGDARKHLLVRPRPVLVARKTA